MPQTYREPTTREQIAAVLASFYRELAPVEPDRFSLTHLVRQLDRPAMNGKSYEQEVCQAHATRSGLLYSPLHPTVPWRALARALDAHPGASGGYLIDAGPRGELSQMLQGFSIIAEAGARVIDAPMATGDFSIPVEKTAASGSWFGPGGSASSGEGTLGLIAQTPHTYVSLIQYAIQLNTEAGPLLDRLNTAALMNAAGTAADTAVITGTGGVQPTGIIHRSDITAQAGAALSFASIVGMKKAVLAGGARESRLRWIGAPDVQETLSKRERSTGSGMIWEGNKIADVPAIATARVPAGYLVLADWSTLTCTFWNGGPEIAIDQSTGFNVGALVARVLMMIDTAFMQPSTVIYASSVT